MKPDETEDIVRQSVAATFARIMEERHPGTRWLPVATEPVLSPCSSVKPDGPPRVSGIDKE